MAKKSKKPKARKAAPAKALKGVSATEIGRRLDMSRQRVGQLEAEGVFSQLAGGRFDMAACTIGYIRWLKDENRRGSKAAGASLFQQVRMKEIEQRIAREDGRLVPIEAVDAANDQIVGTFRSELSGVAAASTRDVELRQVIDGHLNVAIERCRHSLGGAADDMRAGREVLVEGEEADA